MSLILSKINLKNNGLIRLNNSNKSIFIKRYATKKFDESNLQNETTEKNDIKKNNAILNTSVKKIRQQNKISINDYDNKHLIKKEKISNQNKNNKSQLIKKINSINMKKKLDYENKENQRINLKEKADNKKIIKKQLKISGNDVKLKMKPNSPKNKREIKTQILNKNKGSILSNLLNNTENKLIKEKNDKNTSIEINININKKNEPKEITTNKTIIASVNRKNLIENGKTNEQEEELEENKIIDISNDDDIEYTFKYDKNIVPEKKHIFNTNVCTNRTRHFSNIGKNNERKEFMKKMDNPKLDLIHKKIRSENYLFNANNKKMYNSINNNENENGKGIMKIINNFDIIDIISKKEKYKKIFKSIHYNSILNNTKEISEESFIKKYPTLKKKFKLNGLNIIYNSSSNTSREEKEKEKEKEIKKNEIFIAKTVRNLDQINKSTNSKVNQTIQGKDIYNTNSNVNEFHNKWEKRYLVPRVSASLIKSEGKNKVINDNYINNINNNNKYEKILQNKNYNINHRKHVKFGESNKKKREILFNFDNDIRNEKNRNLSFRSNRTNSFINKRNMHITERNSSINNTMNENDKYNLNRDIELDIQEKKLKLIRKEITKYKFRKRCHNLPNICSVSLDKIVVKTTDNNNSNNNKTEHNKKEEIKYENSENNNINKIIQSHKIDKKHRTFLLKIKPLNIINNGRSNFANGNKLVIKRGDLLNRLRKIKQNFNKLEVSSTN